MPYDLAPLAWALAFLTAIAMLVRNERKLTRWLMRGRRRRKRSAVRRPVLW